MKLKIVFSADLLEEVWDVLLYKVLPQLLDILLLAYYYRYISHAPSNPQASQVPNKFPRIRNSRYMLKRNTVVRVVKIVKVILGLPKDKTSTEQGY